MYQVADIEKAERDLYGALFSALIKGKPQNCCVRVLYVESHKKKKKANASHQGLVNTQTLYFECQTSDWSSSTL